MRFKNAKELEESSVIELIQNDARGIASRTWFEHDQVGEPIGIGEAVEWFQQNIATSTLITRPEHDQRRWAEVFMSLFSHFFAYENGELVAAMQYAIRTHGYDFGYEVM